MPWHRCAPDVEPFELAWVAVVVLVAATAQTVSGFGFALLAVPMMTLMVDPKLAVVVATLLGATSSTSQSVIDRGHIDWPLTRRLSLAALVGMPAGLVVFLMVDENTLRVFVGSVVLVAALLLMRGFAISAESTRADWWLGAASGVLATSTSTNGPPLVFLMQAKGLEPATFRATINAVFTAANVVAITLFASTGKVTLEGLSAAAIAVPSMLVGLRIGYLVRPRVRADRFRVLVFVLLVMSAVSAFTAAMLG